MKTKLIGVREFRQNIATLYKEAKKHNLKYIVLSHNQPIFKIEPLDKKDAIIEKLAYDIEEARLDAKKGKVYDFEEVCKEFGI